MAENFKNMKLLLHAIEGINRTMELKQLLLKCMESARKVVDAEASSLMLMDKNTGQLNLSVPTGPVKDEIKGQVIPKNKGVAGWVLETQKPYLINDMAKSKEFYGDISDGFKTRNMICVPLFDSKNEILGIMQVLNKKDAEFTEKDIPVLETLASHVGLSIEKVREVDDLRNSVKDKERRLNNIHKGFQNSLSAINALVQLQLPMLEEEEAKFILKATGSRIETIANAHQVLFHSEEKELMDLGFYIGHLTSTVADIFGIYDKEIRYQLDIDKVQLNASKAITVGLIINEVILLMYKEAFRNIDRGIIRITVKKHNKKAVFISISDDGEGVLEHIEGEAIDSLTSVVVQTLAEKLYAQTQCYSNKDNGSTFVLSFMRDN